MNNAFRFLGIALEIAYMCVGVFIFYLFIALFEWNFTLSEWGTFAKSIFIAVSAVAILSIIWIIRKASRQLH